MKFLNHSKFTKLILISLFIILILGTHSNALAVSETPAKTSFISSAFTSLKLSAEAGWNSFTGTIDNVFHAIFGGKDKVVAPVSTPPASSHLPLAGEEKIPSTPVVTPPPTTIIQQISQAGLTGKVGQIGPQGLRGFTGPQGPKGDKGAPGGGVLYRYL